MCVYIFTNTHIYAYIDVCVCTMCVLLFIVCLKYISLVSHYKYGEIGLVSLKLDKLLLE